ncbi:MAG: pantetheine-phosphate adenylyltransferase [Clostridiales bacterium]|nr:pantetheine-phosphate adenylyltransferase [Clostridiales bacterium]
MKVIVTGSFNPITKGHEDLILRAASIFDEVIVAVFNNVDKKYEFSLTEREKLCRAAFVGVRNVRTVSSDGMVVDLCREENCFLLLRGVRDESDLRYEKMMSEANKRFEPRCETLFMTASEKYERLSSTAVRKIISGNGSFIGLIPEKAEKCLVEILEERKGGKYEK